MKPLHVHYYDNDGFVIYNLTEDQFNKLHDQDDIETIDKFAVETDKRYGECGYAPRDMLLLGDLLGFTVSSE